MRQIHLLPCYYEYSVHYKEYSVKVFWSGRIDNSAVGRLWLGCPAFQYERPYKPGTHTRTTKRLIVKQLHAIPTPIAARNALSWIPRRLRP